MKRGEKRKSRRTSGAEKDQAFIGPAGEHLICAELLFRGFDANRVSTDMGMDIVAVNDQRVLGFQVKTSKEYGAGTYYFNVRKASYDRYGGDLKQSISIYYIFVLRKDEDTRNFLILPQSQMDKGVRAEVLKYRDRTRDYRVSIALERDNVYVGSKKRRKQVNKYLNSWDLL